MLEIDGSGGGGQLLRTALSLSALSGRPFRMTEIREGRPNPGLRPQHLAAVRALEAISDATVEGSSEGSSTLRFQPGTIQPGRHEVDVGTAGSVTLLFDAVLPLAAALDGWLSLRARGGTDVKWAPAMDYFRRVKLPVLRQHGIVVAVDLDRRGFYPAGGGDATLSLGPSTPDAFDLGSDLDAPDARSSVRVYSVATTDLADREVAERQATTAIELLGDLDVTERTVEYAAASSPGSAVTIRLDRGASIAGADALGERGKPAEAVAEDAVERVADVIRTGATVDRHLADQLLVFLGLAGGRLSVPTVSEHVETNLAVLRAFGYDVELDRGGGIPVLRA